MIPIPVASQFNLNLTHRAAGPIPMPDTSVNEVQAPSPSLPEIDFPVEVLPSRLRWLVEDIHRTRGVPAVIPACACLATVAASLGRGLIIRSSGDRVTYGNLFLAVSARTGVGKGSAEPAVQPFRHFQDVERLHWKDALMGYREFLVHAFAGSSPAEPPVPTPRRKHWHRHQPPTLVTEDATGPGLEMLLAENAGLTFMFSSEAGPVLDEISKPKSQLKRLLLKGFSVEPFDSARASRLRVHLSKPCITALWLTQPYRLEALFRNQALIADGFLGRVLVARSNAGMQKVDEQHQGVRLTTLGAYEGLISALVDTYYARFNSGSLEIALDPEGREALVAFQHEIAGKWHACESAAQQDLLVRAPELAWKLTLVLHATDFGGQAHKSSPSLKTVLNAICLVRWFSSQAMAMLSPTECLDPRFQRLLQKLRNQPGQEITVRDLKTRHHFTQSEIDEFLLRFPGHIQLDPGRSIRGGRPSPKIRLTTALSS